jgi:hypothetical protein
VLVWAQVVIPGTVLIEVVLANGSAAAAGDAQPPGLLESPEEPLDSSVLPWREGRRPLMADAEQRQSDTTRRSA